MDEWQNNYAEWKTKAHTVWFNSYEILESTNNFILIVTSVVAWKLGGGQRKHFGVKNMFIILIVVIVSGVSS